MYIEELLYSRDLINGIYSGYYLICDVGLEKMFVNKGGFYVIVRRDIYLEEVR